MNNGLIDQYAIVLLAAGGAVLGLAYRHPRLGAAVGLAVAVMLAMSQLVHR